MPLISVAAGETLTASKLNSMFDVDRMAYAPSDQSSGLSNVTLQNSTYLTLPVAATGSYILESLLIFDCNATADYKFNWALPAGAFIRETQLISQASVAAADGALFHDAVDSAAGAGGGVAAGTFITCRPTGLIIVSSTPGTCVLQFAQNTSNATNATVLKGGSWMRLRKTA